jgi:cobalt/nickel transport system ATP-binding protein
MSTSPVLIEVRNLSFSYHFAKKVLNGVQMSIPRGARIALVGPNGAGKSTLFLHLNAILRPQAGSLLYEGQAYEYSQSFVTRLRQRVGLVFQDPDMQLFAGSVFDDVLFGPMNLKLAPEVAHRQAESALDAVKMLEYRNEPVHFLSHGQKKRVAIAGVLAMEPEVLILDEPTAGLDYSGVLNLNDILARLHTQGTTLVVATHDIEWAWGWTDLVYVLVQGQVVTSGSPADILTRVDHATLGYAQPVLGEVYSELRQRQLIPLGGHLPRTAVELVNLLTC